MGVKMPKAKSTSKLSSKNFNASKSITESDEPEDNRYKTDVPAPPKLL